MGEIVAFIPRIAARPRSKQTSPAQILLFTGVSYERYSGVYEPPVDSGPRRPGRGGAASGKASRQRA